MDLETQAKELREKIGERKKKEAEAETKKRMQGVLKDRDAALRTIYDYQDKTGVPSEEETEKNFFQIEANQKD